MTAVDGDGDEGVPGGERIESEVSPERGPLDGRDDALGVHFLKEGGLFRNHGDVVAKHNHDKGPQGVEVSLISLVPGPRSLVVDVGEEDGAGEVGGAVVAAVILCGHEPILDPGREGVVPDKEAGGLAEGSGGAGHVDDAGVLGAPGHEVQAGGVVVPLDVGA